MNPQERIKSPLALKDNQLLLLNVPHGGDTEPCSSVCGHQDFNNADYCVVGIISHLYIF